MSVSHPTIPMRFDEAVTSATADDNQCQKAVSVSASASTSTSVAPAVVKQWVDWIPQEHSSQDEDDTKLTSLDVTDSHWTTDSIPDEDWHGSVAQEDGDGMMVVVPHAMLIENDPALQHELLLEDDGYQNDASHTLSTDGGAGIDVQTQRRLLYERMKASWQTRRLLRPHIKQRASLAGVLKSIEDSSVTLRRHVLAGTRSSATATATAATTTTTTTTTTVDRTANREQITTREKASYPNASSLPNKRDDENDDDMMICDDPNDQEMLVSALTQEDDGKIDDMTDELEGLDDGVIDPQNSKKHNNNINNHEEDIKYTYVRNHHDHDDITMMTTNAEDDLPEPFELTMEDIDKVDFFWLVRNEQENNHDRR